MKCTFKRTILETCKQIVLIERMSHNELCLLVNAQTNTISGQNRSYTLDMIFALFINFSQKLQYTVNVIITDRQSTYVIETTHLLNTYFGNKSNLEVI